MTPYHAKRGYVTWIFTFLNEKCAEIQIKYLLFVKKMLPSRQQNRMIFSKGGQTTIRFW